jgi:hypothetical protein
VRPEQLRALVQRAAESWLRVVEFAAHTDILRALAGEQEGHFGRLLLPELPADKPKGLVPGGEGEQLSAQTRG